MNLNERESDIYKHLNPGERHELDSLNAGAEFWLKVKNGGLIFIGVAIFLAFIF